MSKTILGSQNKLFPTWYEWLSKWMEMNENVALVFSVHHHYQCDITGAEREAHAGYDTLVS